MKIRKSVTKGIVFVLVFFSFFLFQGCGNLGKENVDSSINLIQENSKEVLVSSSHVPNSSTKKENSLLYFSNDVSVVKVLHSNGGGQKSWNMDKKDIPQFREWVLSLQFKHQNFEKGESPGDSNGGDAYNFRISNDAQLNFTYIDIGNNNHYIEFEGKWYLITTHERIPDFLYND